MGHLVGMADHESVRDRWIGHHDRRAWELGNGIVNDVLWCIRIFGTVDEVCAAFSQVESIGDLLIDSENSCSFLVSH